NRRPKMVAPRRRGARNLLLTYSRCACLSNFRAPKTERVEHPSKWQLLKYLRVGLFSGRRWIASFSPVGVWALARSQHRPATACAPCRGEKTPSDLQKPLGFKTGGKK